MNNNLSSNSFNSNTFSSNGLKSRSRNSKKHSEDFSIRSEIKLAHHDARDLQTFPIHFLPDNMTNNSKQQSSNSNSQKQLTKKILERIESEQKNPHIQEEDENFDDSEPSEEEEAKTSSSKSLSQLEEDIMNTVSNKHSSTNRKMDDQQSLPDSFNEFEQKKSRPSNKKVTFGHKISRAKTFDVNLEVQENSSISKSFKSPMDMSPNNSSLEETKKKNKNPERIYDILKNKKEQHGANKIFENIAVMMLVNHFVRQIKLKSGHFGALGNRQFKILNDLSNPTENHTKNEEEHANILVRLIKKNQLIQKTLKKSNFFKRWTIFIFDKYFHFIKYFHFNKYFYIELGFSWIYRNILSKIKVIMPNHNFKQTLNCFVLAFSIAEFGFIPLHSTFQISNDNLYSVIRNFLLIVLLADIILNFNTGYFHRGTLILDRKEILKRYIRLDFWVEFLSILPSLVVNFIGNEKLLEIYPEISFVEFVFLIRIIYLDKMIRKICDFYQSTEFLNNFISLLKLCIWSLYVAHLCACVFHYVAILDSHEYSETWISDFQLKSEDDSLYSEYITSLYWSVTTMVTVGYGDITPVTPHEKIVAITAMLGACCVFAYIMNSIGSIINSFNNRQTVLRQKIQAVNKYLDMKNIDNDLRIRIRKYLEYLYEEKNSMMKEGHNVVCNLSTSLKTEILQRLNGEIIVNIPILINNFSLKLLSSLTLFMNEYSFTPEDFIFDENILDDQELFFIYEGEVEIYVQNTTGFREDTHLKKLNKSEFFGEIAFFTGQTRTASAISLGFSTLIGIKRTDFINVIKNSSFDYEKLCMIRDNIILYRNYGNLNIRCYSCNYTNHIAKECPMVHVTINPERVIRDHIKIEPTSRRQFPRFQKKFKALSHLDAMIRACIKLHRTTTLEMSTVTVEQEDCDDDEDDEDDEMPDSPSKRPVFSPFRKGRSASNMRSLTIMRSKSSIRNLSEENFPTEEKEKFFNFERKEKKKERNTIFNNTVNQGTIAGSSITGGFESYINNMNAIMENERGGASSPRKKKLIPTQSTIIIPKTPNDQQEFKRKGSTSPTKKRLTTRESTGKFQEHQKMVAEALMLHGLNNNQQENLAKMSYFELMNQFDKMKNFEIYFPYNNVDVIVEICKNLQRNSVLKRKKSRFKKGNSSSPQEFFNHNFSSFYQQMSFKQIFKKETLNTHNSNYEDLMYRRAITQNEGSPAKKLRLLPTKSLNYSKGINTIKQNLRKCQTMKKKITKAKFFWMCYSCKKKKNFS